LFALTVLIVLLFVTILFFMLWVPWAKRTISLERRQWERELKEQRLKERERMKVWEDELRERQERERQREEQWHREEEERQRLGLYWDNLEADAHCSGYRTRYYWARLLNTVPYQYNWLKPCRDIPIDIHGRSINATTCEIKDDVSLFVQSPRPCLMAVNRGLYMGVGEWISMNLLAHPTGFSSRTKCVQLFESDKFSVYSCNQGCAAPGSGRHVGLDKWLFKSFLPVYFRDLGHASRIFTGTKMERNYVLRPLMISWACTLTNRSLVLIGSVRCFLFDIFI
jgi:hypothetical protein